MEWSPISVASTGFKPELKPTESVLTAWDVRAGRVFRGEMLPRGGQRLLQAKERAPQRPWRRVEAALQGRFYGPRAGRAELRRSLAGRVLVVCALLRSLSAGAVAYTSCTLRVHRGTVSRFVVERWDACIEVRVRKPLPWFMLGVQQVTHTHTHIGMPQHTAHTGTSAATGPRPTRH